jgi:hypothetical protein
MLPLQPPPPPPPWQAAKLIDKMAATKYAGTILSLD